MLDTFPNSRMGAGGLNARSRTLFTPVILGALERFDFLDVVSIRSHFLLESICSYVLQATSASLEW